MYEAVLLWATPVFLVLMAIECAVAWRRRRSEYRLADALASVSLGAVSTYVGVFTRLLTVGIYVAVYREVRVATLDPGSAWVWAGGIVLYDFLYYWNHRLGHEVNILWAAHVVHHQSEEFNLSTALRQSGSSFLLSWIFYLPMAVLGFPPALFLVVSLIDLLYQFWIHTEQIGSLGVFDRVFASPSNHRVHHAVNDRYVDRNYGGILILWDRIFGTFQPELATDPVVYGTRDPLRSWSPLWANLHTYARIIGTVATARSWNDRMAIIWRRPGWQPGDGSAGETQTGFDLRGFRKYGPPLPAALGLYCLVQGVVVLGFGAHFMAVATKLPPLAAVGYCAALVASLSILGGLAEARRGFVWAECSRLLGLGVIALLQPAARSWPAAVLVGGSSLALAGWLIWSARAVTSPVPA